MKKLNSLKSKLYSTKVIFLFFFILLLGTYANTFAISSPYSQGQTLDPACTPGEANCTVTSTPTSVSGGLGGQILYQSDVDTTSKLANGTAGQVLTSGGTTVAPSWTTLPITVVDSSNLFSTGLTGTGTGVVTPTYSNFFGVNAGYNLGLTTNIYESNFIGHNAGYQARFAFESNFIGHDAGSTASNAANSNFIGSGAGSGAHHAISSNFFGKDVGQTATNASYSNLFGYRVGLSFTNNNIGSNNIIIGTNISLPDTVADAINLGGVLFATGTYSTTTGDPSITAVADGKIGIGTLSPQYKLHVFAPSQENNGLVDVMAVEVGATTSPSKLNYGPSILFKDIPGGGDVVNLARIAAVYESNGSNYTGALSFSTNDQTSSAILLPIERMRISAAGFVGIGMTDPSVALDVTGDIEYTGIITDVSDERLKENISPITGALDMVLGIQGKYYNMINTPNRMETGFMAQNVKQYVPSAVSIVDPKNGYMGVSYSSLIPVAFEAIKELDLKIEKLSSDTISSASIDLLVKTFLVNSVNWIEDMFVNRVHTKEICVSDNNGETCIIRSQLDALLSGAVGNSGGVSIATPTIDFCPNVTGTQIESDDTCIDTLCLLPNTWNIETQACDVVTTDTDPLVCISPQTLVDDACVDPVEPTPIVCILPQVLNTTGDECIDPIVSDPVTITCEVPQVVNTEGDACVDPTPIPADTDVIIPQ